MTTSPTDEQGDDGVMALPSDRATAAEPVVSALRDGIPSADAWRTDSPTFGKRPIWQFVFLQGSSDHMGDGRPWRRCGWGTAGIRTNDAPDGLLGYRRADIERICRDNDIDLWTAKVVGWLPMAPPALLTDRDRPALMPCDDGEYSAQAIEARRAETLGSACESPVPQECGQSSAKATRHD